MATAAFTIGMLAGPSLTPGRTPQAMALLSCLLAATGLTLSAAGDSAWLVILGFGVLFGLANGLAYSSSLQVVQHVAPHRPGLYTGMAVSSYMLGSVVGSPLLSAVLEVWNYRLALLILAAYLAAAGTLASLLLHRSRIGCYLTDHRTEAIKMRAPFGAMTILWAVFSLAVWLAS